VRLSQTPGLALRLEQAENVVLADRALDVADDGAGLVVHELDTALGDTTTGAGTAKDTGDLDELDGGLSGFHFVRLLGSTKGGRAVCGFARRMGRDMDGLASSNKLSSLIYQIIRLWLLVVQYT
jgi:hypothetical protein